jgi:hypothetical protein
MASITSSIGARLTGVLCAAILSIAPVAAAAAAPAPSPRPSPSPSPSAPKSGGDPTKDPHSPGSWWVQPAPKQGDSNQRQYFILEGKPGQTLQDGLAVSNYTDHAIAYRVYGADGYNTPHDGQFALRDAAFPMTGVGTWIKPAFADITVPARTATVIPITVTIPVDATPGDHVGGVSGLDTAVEAVQQQGNVRVGIKRVVAARLYLHVDGPAVGGLTVSGLRVSAPSPFPAYLSDADGAIQATVTNSGNLVQTPKAHVIGKGLFGTLIDRTVQMPQILPGQSVDFSTVWAKVPPFDVGSVKLEVTDDSADPAVTSSASVSLTLIPWYSVLILALGLGGAVAGLVLWRRKKHPRPLRRTRRSTRRPGRPKTRGPAKQPVP